MSARKSWWVVAAVMMSVALAGVLPAAPAADAVKVKAGRIDGHVSDSSGKALAEVAVRLMKDGEEVCSVKSDKAGAYKLAELAEGRYELFVGAQKPLPLLASAEAETTTLRIILPQTSGYGQSEVLGMPTWAVVGGGVIITAAIVTPIIIHNTRDDGDGVSPKPR